MREVKPETAHKGQSLFSTMGISFVIAGFITLAALLFLLVQNAPAGAGVEYYLPWALPYGIVNVLIASLGVAFSSNAKEKPGWYFPGFIIGIVCGALLFLEGLPLAIFLSNVEFTISVMVIGACVVAISIVGLTQLKEE